MNRYWESVYANLGDATDCLRDAIRTIQKELPRATAGNARGAPTVDVTANLKERIAEIQKLIHLVEQDRSDFYISHSPEVRSAVPQPNFLFGVPLPEA